MDDLHILIHEVVHVLQLDVHDLIHKDVYILMYDVHALIYEGVFDLMWDVHFSCSRSLGHVCTPKDSTTIYLQ